MADKSKEPGSLTQKADENIERVAEVSNVSRTINEMQKKVDQQIVETGIDTGEYEKIEEVQNSMLKVLSSLSFTVNSISKGFAKVAAGTAQSSKEAISQYSKAISQDISYNKQNIVAIALSRSTPIFGYFASKFMETDVYKSAAEKMKQNMQEAFSHVSAGFKRGLLGMFRGFKVKKTTIQESGEEGAKKATGAKSTIKKVEEAVPKLQTGGYVERAGLAKLHAAEVVVPIDKILSRIDESIEISKELASISKKAQLNTLAKMSTYVSGIEHMEKVGIFKGFLRAYSDVQKHYMEPANVRMLRAVLAIQDTLGAQIGTWQQVWQKMLVNHPTFRNIMFTLRSMKSIIGTPIDLVYHIFKSRGGYKSHLSKAKNPMQATAENVGLVYSEGMWRLDNIAKFTRATAEAARDLSSAITGKKYKQLEGIPTGAWSILGITRAVTNFATKWGLKGLGLVGEAFTPKAIGNRFRAGMDALAETLTKDRELFTTKLLDMLPYRKQMKGVYGGGGTTEAIPEKLSRRIDSLNAIPVIDIETSDINRAILEFSKNDKKTELKYQKKKDQKLLGYSKDLLKVNEESLGVQKKMNLRQKIQSVRKMFGGVFETIKNLVMPLLPFLLGGKKKIGGWIAGMIGPIFKQGFISFFKNLFTKGGFLKLLKGGGKFFSVAAIVGVIAQGVRDAIFGRKKAEKWGTSKSSGMLGAYIGGIGSGWKGAGTGAMKGLAAGAGIGTLVGGPIGTAIGGAVGAIAGGIMGAIGGKNIAKGLDYMKDKIKAIVKAIKNFISWPFKFLWSMIIKVKEKFFKKKSKVNAITEKLPTMLQKPFMWMVDLVSSAYNKVKEWFVGFKDSFPDKIESIIGYMKKPFNWMTGMVHTGYSKVKDWISSNTSFMSDILSKTIGYISAPLTWMKDIVGSGYIKIKEWLLDKFGSVPVIGKMIREKLKTSKTDVLLSKGKEYANVAVEKGELYKDIALKKGKDYLSQAEIYKKISLEKGKGYLDTASKQIAPITEKINKAIEAGKGKISAIDVQAIMKESELLQKMSSISIPSSITNILTDKVPSIIVEGTDLAKEKALEVTTQTKKLAAELKEQTKAAKEHAKELGASVNNGLAYTSNAVTSSIQNINVSTASRRITEFSDTTKSILAGLVP